MSIFASRPPDRSPEGTQGVTGSVGPPGRRAPGAVVHRLRGPAASASRSVAYCALVLPVSLGALLALLRGRADLGNTWWNWLRTRVLGVQPTPAQPAAGPGASLSHGLLSLLLGVATLPLVALEGLVVVRSMFYGLVDRGPYTDSWGGPSAAGAWLAHLAVGLPLALAGALALAGIAAVHHRLTLALYGERRGGRLVAVTIVIAALGGVLLVAWLRQVPS
jgi:hypothetical protein